MGGPGGAAFGAAVGGGAEVVAAVEALALFDAVVVADAGGSEAKKSGQIGGDQCRDEQQPEREATCAAGKVVDVDECGEAPEEDGGNCDH